MGNDMCKTDEFLVLHRGYVDQVAQFLLLPFHGGDVQTHAYESANLAFQVKMRDFGSQEMCGFAIECTNGLLTNNWGKVFHDLDIFFSRYLCIFLFIKLKIGLTYEFFNFFTEVVALTFVYQYFSGF